ncbi:MAG: peroxiredoxin [Cryomorphaceae bacterium]|nr:MAG: peroxiredoxin [Cryomorphaceae bacterium]
MLQVGQSAPDFTLKNAQGEEVRLYNLLSRGDVVLYFYPKDETRGCTAQACAFRDSYEEFKDAGAEVVGVSSDGEQDHAGFANNHRLPFILLSDPNKEVRKLYEVPNSLLFIPGRVTYVIGTDQKIRMAFNSMFKPEEHIQQALKVLGK